MRNKNNEIKYILNIYYKSIVHIFGITATITLLCLAFRLINWLLVGGAF